MKHKKIKNLLGSYLDGELHSTLRKAVEEHLRICPECSEELNFLRVLHKKIKEEKIPFPADSYWDYFPKRVMERLREKKAIRFFSIKIPRIKWELAGGLILILLTFIVSKQILMEKGIKGVGETTRTVESFKITTEEGFIAKDEERMEAPPVAAGKTLIKVHEEEKGKKVIIEKGAIPSPAERKEIFKKAVPVSSVSKAPDIEQITGEKIEVIGGVNGLREKKTGEIIDVGFAGEAAQIMEKEKEELDILADINAKEDYLRTSKDKVKSKQVRRGLLRLLYVEASRTRKKGDIERALKEVEAYCDSYPDDFRDTLIVFSDSLRIMMEEIIKESQTTEDKE